MTVTIAGKELPKELTKGQIRKEECTQANT